MNIVRLVLEQEAMADKADATFINILHTDDAKDCSFTKQQLQIWELPDSASFDSSH
jgi:hypothetical protein